MANHLDKNQYNRLIGQDVDYISIATQKLKVCDHILILFWGGIPTSKNDDSTIKESLISPLRFWKNQAVQVHQIKVKESHMKFYLIFY